MVFHVDKGQSIAEYTLAAALVAVVGFGALIYLANTVSADLPEFLDRIFLGGPASGPPGVTATLPGPTPALIDVGAADLEIKLGNGETITLPGFATDLATAVETNGVNGATSTWASQIQQVAEALRASGELNEVQAGKLVELANQGHRLAMIERLIEDAAAADTQFNFRSHYFTFEGNQYCPEELAQMVTSGAPHATDPMNPGPGREMAHFNSLLQEAKASGALNSPAIEQVVTHLAEQIRETGGSFYKVTSELHDNEANPHIHGPLCQHVASSMTDRNSVGICVSGGGEDGGRNCQ